MVLLVLGSPFTSEANGARDDGRHGVTSVSGERSDGLEYFLLVVQYWEILGNRVCR